jgi:hypothetical protein
MPKHNRERRWMQRKDNMIFSARHVCPSVKAGYEALDTLNEVDSSIWTGLQYYRQGDWSIERHDAKEDKECHRSTPTSK